MYLRVNLRRKIFLPSLAIACLLQSLTSPAFAEDEAELAKKLANPVAALISVPIQVNYDENYGANEQGSV